MIFKLILGIVAIIIIFWFILYKIVENKRNEIIDCLKLCCDKKWKLDIAPIYINKFKKIKGINRFIPGYDIRIVLQPNKVTEIISKNNIDYFIYILNEELLDLMGIKFVVKIIYLPSIRKKFEVVVIPRFLEKYW